MVIWYQQEKKNGTRDGLDDGTFHTKKSLYYNPETNTVRLVGEDYGGVNK